MDPRDSLDGRSCRAQRARPLVAPLRSILHLALCLPLITTFGCDALRAPTPDDELRIVFNPWPGYSFLYLADELGYFGDEGISVRLIELGGLADVRRVFENGQADVICCTLVEVLLMNESRAAGDARIFMVCDYSAGGDMLLARSVVGSLADLRGRRVGLEPASLDGLCVHLALQSAGLSVDDVTIVPLAPSEMVDALRQGEVDAVQVYPPAAAAALELPGVHKLWDTASVPGLVVDVLAARQPLLAQRTTTFRALLRAYRRAQQFFRDHPSDALRILSRRYRLSEDALKQSFNDMELFWLGEGSQDDVLNGGQLAETVATTAKELVAVGMLRQLPAEDPFDGRLFGSPEPSPLNGDPQTATRPDSAESPARSIWNEKVRSGESGLP